MGIEADWAPNWTIAVKDVPESGLRGEWRADSQQCDAFANLLGILGCSFLQVTYRVAILKQGRYRITGEIKAAVVQACIVTLDPVPSDLVDAIDIEFWPEDQIEKAEATKTEPKSVDDDQVTWLDPNAADPPEAIEQGRIALGRLVFEQVAAALDPYPRKPDVAFDWKDPRDKGDNLHPFASLSQLKPKT